VGSLVQSHTRKGVTTSTQKTAREKGEVSRTLKANKDERGSGRDIHQKGEEEERDNVLKTGRTRCCG